MSRASQLTIEMELHDYDLDEDFVVDLPAKYEVCDRCEGHGTILNPAIGEHAYTREEFHESFDEEEREQYFKRGGRYDITCPECKGKNVVLVVDRETTWPTVEGVADLKKCYEQYERRQMEMAAERRAEERWGY